MAKSRRPRKRASRRPSGGAKISALRIELEHTSALCRRHTEELAIQFKRIAQLQAELDEVKKALRVGP
jgi:hypothetical protein